MPDSRRQDEDVSIYFESQATQKMACDRLANTIVVDILKFRTGFSEVA
ncbi:MAG: hypothetical protein RBR84_06755 [Bacteroidales bacterium]|jgi:hypothetical protein|nr:hypothetical protein [Bacteroidales bacterium]